MRIKELVSLTVTVLMMTGMMTKVLAQDQFEIVLITVDNAKLFDLAIIDWNDDGFNDIITTGDDGMVLLAQQNGPIPLTFEQSVLHSMGRSEPSINYGDFNQDGVIDLVTQGNGYIFSLAVWYRNGDEFDEYELTHFLSDNARSVVADINNDNLPDVVAGATNTEMKWWENLGDGEFIEHIVIPNLYDVDRNLEVVDMNGDGNLDLVVAQNSTEHPHYLYWYEQVPGEDWERYLIKTSFSIGLGTEVVDLDMDGDEDVLVDIASNLTLFLNDGEQSFTEIVLFEDNITTRDIEAFDFDADGDLDLLITAYMNGEKVLYLENNGDLEFEILYEYELSAKGNEIRLGDIDGDGSIDAALCAGEYGADTSSVVILQNQISHRFEGFSKITPLDHSVLVQDTVVASWTPPSEFENPIYTLTWSTSLGFDSEFTYEVETEDTSFAMTPLPDHTRVYWNVTFEDEVNRTIYSDHAIYPWSFHVDNETAEQPGQFGLVSPRDGEIYTPNLIAFIFEETSDIDFQDTITYEVWIDRNDDLSDAWMVGERSGIDRVFVHNLPGEETLYWTVHARDTNTEGTWANDTLMFMTSALNTIESINIDASLPTAFEIHSVSPNPFNPTTTISYDLPESSTMTLKVYDLLGHEVAVLVEGSVTAGRHKVVLDGRRLGSGIYFVEMRTAIHRSTKKLVLMK